MEKCSSCGDSYLPQSAAWGSRCGLCIAAQIELMLMGPPEKRARKGVKRTASDGSAHIYRQSECDRADIRWLVR